LQWTIAVVHEALTLEKLSALEPREAAAYFIARRAEGLSSSEQELLSGWLANDEVHRRMFESADHAWQSFAEVEGDEVLAAMRAHALAKRPRAFAFSRPLAVAAAVVLLAAGGALFFDPALNPWAPQSVRHGSASDSATQYASARGEVKDIPLPDGSTMTLDADSAAVRRFNTNSRTVDLLRGRAFFAVMPDQSRPFVVAAGGRSVVAVGTRFDVNLVPDGLTVTLLDGHVEVRSPDPALAHVTLDPGQQYIERRGKATIRTIGAASENEISWRVGLVNFDDQPLAEAAAVMNRYSPEQIVISDPTVASIRVSGQFRAGDARRFAATLAEIHKLRSIRRGDQIELAPRN
jgi:transmembrane sensor